MSQFARCKVTRLIDLLKEFFDGCFASSALSNETRVIMRNEEHGEIRENQGGYESERFERGRDYPARFFTNDVTKTRKLEGLLLQQAAETA